MSYISFFLFVKQKAAYDRRIRDWSSDVCSSDLYSNTQTVFGLDLTGKVKFGTADEDEGLGTGQEDYSGLLDAYQQFGEWTVFGGVGYTTFGDSAFIRQIGRASCRERVCQYV